MTLMLAKTYAAFKAAGVAEAEAQAAAEEIAENRVGYENRLIKIESDLELIKAQMATKAWTLTTILAQTFVLLGGIAALIKLLH